MHDDLRVKAINQHTFLMSRVEALIRALYAVKGDVDHRELWFVISSLEIFKKQATLLYKFLLTEMTATGLSETIVEMRNELTASLESITELARPMLTKGD